MKTFVTPRRVTKPFPGNKSLKISETSVFVP